MGVATSGPGRPGPLVPQYARLLGERIGAALVPLELAAAEIVRSATELLERAGVEPLPPSPELAAADWPADTPEWVRSLDRLVLGNCYAIDLALAQAETALLALH